MDRKKKIADLIVAQGILPLYFHPDVDVSIQILRALYKAGIRVVEYTNRGATALDNFFQLEKVVEKELPALHLGAGTIRNKIEATEFINGGAHFIVCPGVVEEVATLAHKNNLLWVPGCLTATEIIQADDLGAQLIKIFPASLLGPSYIKAIKEIFPDLWFMPTGGIEINEENLTGWFKNEVSAVGIGNKLISKDLLESKDYAGIELLTRQTLEMVQKIKLS